MADNAPLAPPPTVTERARKFKQELLRKGIHLLIAFAPMLAGWNKICTIILLAAGSAFYLFCEALRLRGITIPVLSKITASVVRPRETGKIVLGPVTLAAGAALSLALFPLLDEGHLALSAVAIYALAFGDGLSGLVGRPFGRLRPRFLSGKSLEGSVVCFLAVTISAYAVTKDLRASLITAFFTTIVEALPLRSADNIIIPLAAGGAAYLALYWF